MKKKVLLIAALMAFCSANSVYVGAADVTDWTGMNTNENINIANDINVADAPGVINLLPNIEQIIDGNGYSIIGKDGSYFNISGVGNVDLNNLGKYSDSGNNTFSYIDISGNRVSKNIDASVNSFTKFISYTGSTTSETSIYSINNSVFANNTGTLFNFGQPKFSLNIKDSILYNNTSSASPSVAFSNNIALEEFSLKMSL